MRRLVALARIERPSEKVLREIHGRSRQDRGKIAAVEPRSGRYFLGKTLVDAANEARKSFPGGTFYFVRVGSRTAQGRRALALETR
jgi:hypothetical protein